MPNWCDNTLNIAGKKEDISKFLLDFWSEEDNAFTMKKLNYLMIGNDNVEKYGTKWDISCEDDYADVKSKLEEDNFDGSVYLSYETAWSPNTQFVKRVSLKYTDLAFTLEYYESGMCFVGSETYKKGDRVEYEYAELNDSSEIDYYSLVLKFDFEDIDYLSECDLDENIISQLTKLDEELTAKRKIQIIDLTDFFSAQYIMPEPK